MTSTRTLTALAAGAVLAAAAPATASAGTVTLSGSTSVSPLVTSLAKAYAARSSTKFRLFAGGSDIGIADAARGRVSLGMSSRDPQPGDPRGLQFNRIARDGVCIVTNRANQLPDISQATVQAIFSGRVRNWKDVPGSRVSGSIALITRTAASGTQDAFQNIFMGQRLRVAGSASQKASNGLVQQSVRSNRLAIGYVDFKFVGGLGVAPYKGTRCNLRNAKSGTYGGLRNFWLVSRGAPSGDARAFLRFIRSSSGQRIVARDYVSLR